MLDTLSRRLLLLPYLIAVTHERRPGRIPPMNSLPAPAENGAKGFRSGMLCPKIATPFQKP
jgi:hypothetical protein